MKIIIIKLIYVLFCVLCLQGSLFAGGSSDSPSKDTASETQLPNKIRFVLDWTPNTNHIGFFVAKEKGFFAQRNLAVEIIPFSDTNVELLVANEQAEFGISYQENFTFARAADDPLPIIAIATVIQHNSSGFASLKNKNIRSPKDFIGKKYGAFGSPIENAMLDYLLKPYNASGKDLEFIQAWTLDFFTAIETGIYDFAWVFEGWTGVEAELRNQDLDFQLLKDLNPVFDYYTPIIISSKSFLESQPSITRDFMDAVKQGYDWTVRNKKEATEVLVNHEPSLDKNLVEKSLDYLAPRFQDDAEYWGEMQDKVWIQFTQWLQEQGFVSKDFDIAGSYTNEFIQ